MRSDRKIRDNRRQSVTAIVRERISHSKDRLWAYRDFSDLPPGAVSQALSRLSQDGVLQRVRRGLYYHPRQTVIGQSRVSSSSVVAAVIGKTARPTGMTASHLLGFTTQNPAVSSYVVYRGSAPAGLRGVKIRARRSKSGADLDDRESAILEFLRDRGQTSELSPDETVKRLVKMLRDPDLFARLVEAGMTEPPRVRAMLGALGQEAGADPLVLETIRRSLNRLSRFDFGHLRKLHHAKEWQAK